MGGAGSERPVLFGCGVALFASAPRPRHLTVSRDAVRGAGARTPARQGGASGAGPRVDDTTDGSFDAACSHGTPGTRFRQDAQPAGTRYGVPVIAPLNGMS